MNNPLKKLEDPARNGQISRAGYKFYEDDSHWVLDKNNKVAVGSVVRLLDANIATSYVASLAFFARNYSGGHTRNINEKMLHFLRSTGASKITENALINYRASLPSNKVWFLGVVRTFIRKWHDLRYPGISEEIVELLYGWTIKGCVKGDVVKRLDPMRGPLSDIELQGFNEGVVQAYEKNKIAISELALALVISNTGRRPIQISHLKIRDVLSGKNKRNEQTFLLNIPRAKQRGAIFRQESKQYAITRELWVILNAQSLIVRREILKQLGFEVDEALQLELPLFPDMQAISKVNSPSELKILIQSDRLHITSHEVTKAIKSSTRAAEIYSERTGKAMNTTSYRFRYTTGTRAAREGFGPMVIAELLDHSDNQNAGIYIENIPDHVERLDKAVGSQLARYAQAFAGVLVNTEKDAFRGSEINSRIKRNEQGIGTCGSHGFCGANVPIPCYTCIHFQAWLDGPHEIVLEELIAERARVLEITGDIQIAAATDRAILAVTNVIQLCAKRRGEVGNG